MASHGELASAARAWIKQDLIVQTYQIIGFLTGIAFFALLLASQVNTLVRLYEGYYWDRRPLVNQLHALGVRWHTDRLKTYQADLDRHYEDLYRRYPWPTNLRQVMPTDLGNILKSAELYSMSRYEVDSVFFWPRLYYLFPESFANSVAELRSSLDQMVVVSFLSTSFSLLSAGYLLWVHANWLFFLSCFWGGAIVAWLAYRGAVGNALVYAEHIRSAFDLYRDLLLKQMRLKLPPNLTEERKLWTKVGKVLYRLDEPPGEPVLVYDEEKPAGEDEPEDNQDPAVQREGQ